MKVIYEKEILDLIIEEKTKADIMGLQIKKIILSKYEADLLEHQRKEFYRVSTGDKIFGINIEVEK